MQKAHFTPNLSIRVQHGVTKREYLWGDLYVGTAEALVASGVAPLDLFPGQTGCPAKMSASYWPEEPLCDGAWGVDPIWGVWPRKLTIRRRRNGTYEAAIWAGWEVEALRKVGQPMLSAARCDQPLQAFLKRCVTGLAAS